MVKQDGGPTQGSGGSPVYGRQQFRRYSQSGRQFRRQLRQFRQQRSGGSGGPGSPSGSGSGPGGSNVTIVEVQS